MKIKRFVKEYAKFRIDEINNLIELATFPMTIERLTRARGEIFQLVKACEMGLITINEAMKAIADIEF